jgi:hypothetical protein
MTIDTKCRIHIRFLDQLRKIGHEFIEAMEVHCEPRTDVERGCRPRVDEIASHATSSAGSAIDHAADLRA